MNNTYNTFKDDISKILVIIGGVVVSIMVIVGCIKNCYSHCKTILQDDYTKANTDYELSEIHITNGEQMSKITGDITPSYTD